MNKKQLISMWCGIAAIVLVGLSQVGHLTDLAGGGRRGDPVVAYGGFLDFVVYAFLISLVTAGLILTFKDKNPKKPQDD
jgi:hypothetical protein